MLQVDHASPKPKVMGSLLTGNPHSGKTTAVRQFKKAYLDNVEGALPRDILIFQIPSRARLKGVMGKMGRQLKIPDIPPNPGKNYPTYVLVEQVARKLWKDGTKLVIVDEFQKLFELPGESRVEILSGFNDLLNESHVPIVLVGVVGVDRILDLAYHEDESNLKGSFCSRFPEFRLHPWRNSFDIHYVELLKTIFEDCGFQGRRGTPPFYKSDGIREQILQLTGGLTGKIIHLIKWAARQIIRKGYADEITPDLLDETVRLLQAKGW